jgi:ferrochelatase
MLCRFMPHNEKLGVLLVAHGTVTTLEEIPDFLLAIRRGRPPTSDLVSEMVRRYDAIGGSPLLRSTREQAVALESILKCPVYVGMRFSRPTIEEAARFAQSERCTSLVVLPLAPYSVKTYVDDVRKRLEAMPGENNDRLELLDVTSWGNHPDLIQAHADNISAYAKADLEAGARLILSAHSLPIAFLKSQDDYPQAVAESARAIAERLGVNYVLCYQSAGAEGGTWLGPTLTQGLRSAVEDGHRRLVVAPIGFLCDHVETLYDLDIEFSNEARSLGVTVKRVPALGTHPGLLRALASLVRASWSRRTNPISTTIEGTSP